MATFLRVAAGPCVRPGSSSPWVAPQPPVPSCRCLAAPVRGAQAHQHRRLTRMHGIPVSGPGQASVPDPSGAPAGQISASLMESMKSKIGEALETNQVVVQDVYGDGRHVSIDVVSAAFEGKNAVQRQRMVYKAIWLELQEAVHAVDAMTTKTPQEAS